MNQKGFLATSLIYSFFLVFIVLMMTILARAANNRILLNSLKKDIRTELGAQEGFITDSLPNRNYAANELIDFANENWRVLLNNASSVVLVLERALSKDEVENAIRRVSTNTEFFEGNPSSCNDAGCLVRACRAFYSGQEFCYQYPSNTALHLKPSWNPSQVQVQNQKFGKTIVSEVVNNWFENHMGLKRAKNNNKLVRMTFSDGYNVNTTGYVRLPKSSGENLNVAGLRPFHLIDSPNNETQIRIYNETVSAVVSYSSAYIRPVIEVKKG